MDTNHKGLTPEMVALKADGHTYREIGEQVGVSRQRIQQLFQPKPPTMAEVYIRADGHCEECGQIEQFGHYHHKQYTYENLNAPDNIVYLCPGCHMKDGTQHPCPNCGAPVPRRKKFCSRGCYKAFHQVTMECFQCHKVFSVGASDKRGRVLRNTSGNFFCSKHCQGVYVGAHYGWGVQLRTKRPSKFDPLIPQIIARMRNGETLQTVMLHMGIRRGNHVDLKKRITDYQAGVSPARRQGGER